jgi:glycosyltransferase involved in cell wall biosynthesis
VTHSKGEGVLVILPALNEEVAIAATILELQKILPQSLVIVVDNGSTDNTLGIAKKNGARVLSEPRRGKGFAVRRALLEVPKEIAFVFILDADDTYEVAPVCEALSMMSELGLDMVVGTRSVSKDSNVGRNSAYRRGHRVGNQLLSQMYQCLFNIHISDTLSGWRLLSRPFIDTFISTEKGFQVEAELNAHAFTLQCGVGNIEVQYQGRHFDSHSKLSTYSDGIRIALASLRMFRTERPSLAFNLLSLPWVITGLVLSGRSLNEYIKTSVVLHFPSLIVGVGFLVVGSLLWVTGMILERVKILRHAFFQLNYKNSFKNNW